MLVVNCTGLQLGAPVYKVYWYHTLVIFRNSSTSCQLLVASLNLKTLPLSRMPI